MGTIASFEYRNGRFGANTASLARVSNGYLFRNGFYDPMFVASPVEAKRVYRDFCAAQVSA